MRRSLIAMAVITVVMATVGLSGGQASAKVAASRQESTTAALHSRVVFLPESTAAVHGCQIDSGYPGGYPVCGYEQDGPWLFPSGRSVTCWAGIQYNSNHTYRYWAKCHAKGVHGTIVNAKYTFHDADVDLYTASPYSYHSHVGTGCITPCVKTGKDVYWTGQWRAHPGSPYGILLRYEVKAEILTTQDVTSTHCVPSEIWFLVYYNNAPAPNCTNSGH
jgi:hypothetical protein